MLNGEAYKYACNSHAGWARCGRRHAIEPWVSHWKKQGRAAAPAVVGCGPHYLPESRLLPSRRSLLLLRTGESRLLPSRRSLLLLRGRDRRLTGLEARRRGGVSRWGRRSGVGDLGRLRVSGLTRLRRSGDRALRRSGDLDLCQSRDLQQVPVSSMLQQATWILRPAQGQRRQSKWPAAWEVSWVGLRPSAPCIWIASQHCGWTDRVLVPQRRWAALPQVAQVLLWVSHARAQSSRACQGSAGTHALQHSSVRGHASAQQQPSSRCSHAAAASKAKIAFALHQSKFKRTQA